MLRTFWLLIFRSYGQTEFGRFLAYLTDSGQCFRGQESNVVPKKEQISMILLVPINFCELWSRFSDFKVVLIKFFWHVLHRPCGT